MKKCKDVNCESNVGKMKKGFCNYHYKVDYDLLQKIYKVIKMIQFFTKELSQHYERSELILIY